MTRSDPEFKRPVGPLLAAPAGDDQDVLAAIACACEAFYYLPHVNGAVSDSTVEEVRVEASAAMDEALAVLHPLIDRPLTAKQVELRRAAPAGTPSGRWWCTAHESGKGPNGTASADSLPGPCWLWQTDTAAPCVWVELLVPATTEPEPDETAELFDTTQKDPTE